MLFFLPAVGAATTTTTTTTDTSVVLQLAFVQ
jgi:hypothetical protein